MGMSEPACYGPCGATSVGGASASSGSPKSGLAILATALGGVDVTSYQVHQGHASLRSILVTLAPVTSPTAPRVLSGGLFTSGNCSECRRTWARLPWCPACQRVQARHPHRAQRGPRLSSNMTPATLRRAIAPDHAEPPVHQIHAVQPGVRGRLAPGLGGSVRLSAGPGALGGVLVHLRQGRARRRAASSLR